MQSYPPIRAPATFRLCLSPLTPWAAVREQCLALGADAFLLKPFTYDELMRVTRLLLARTE